MAVDVYDDAGQPARPGVKGELVCTSPFPSMPLGFWGDDDGSRFRAAYFERFPGVWAHGDFAAWTEHGGMVIHGRSDATLNAGGVRIGTAEIYRAGRAAPRGRRGHRRRPGVGRRHPDRAVRAAGRRAPRSTTSWWPTIRGGCATHCSPRHVPARIVAVDDIPRTRSGKLVELAVADVVNGREVRNTEALANPEALDLFRDRPELQS